MSLIDLKDLKQFIHIEESFDDSNLQGIINGEILICENWIGQNLSEATVTEYHDGGYNNIILLNNGCIVSVTSVKTDDGTGSYGTELVHPDDYEWYSWGKIIKKSGIFFRGFKNIEVVYKHGYTSSNIPMDLKMALMKMMANTYLKSFQVVESEGEKSSVYSQKEIENALKKYMRITV